MFGSIISYRTPIPKFGWKFWKRLTNYQWLQRTFTGKPETHCAIFVGELHRLEKGIVYDAGLSVRFDYWKFNNNYHTVYQIGVDERELKKIIDTLIYDFNNTIYGMFQLPYFLIRWALPFIDTRKWWFPFRAGKICSELVWEYLYRIGRKKNWQDLIDYLNQWDKNNFHAGDCREVLDKFSGRYFNKIKGI